MEIRLLKRYVIIAGFLLGLASCSKPRGIKLLGYRNLALRTSGLLDSRIKGDLVFYNPNGFVVEVKKADINIFLNETAVGTFTQDTLIAIPPKDTFYYPVQLKMDLNSLFKNFNNMWNNGLKDSAVIRAEGQCKVGRNGIFISCPVHYANKIDLSALRGR